MVLLRDQVDTAYWVDPIRRIKFESASIVVEIDLTWSLWFVFVDELVGFKSFSVVPWIFAPICITKVLIDVLVPYGASVEAHISLIKLEFSSCLFVDSLIEFDLAVLVKTAPLESRIYRVGTSKPL
ncbi:hypothetical protein Tco_0016893 [Tanacetum coccineum]